MSSHNTHHSSPSANEQRRADALLHVAGALAERRALEPSDHLPTNRNDLNGTAHGDLSRRIVEASADCTVVLTLDGLVEFMNQNGRRLMEIDDADGVRGRSWLEFWSQHQRSGLQDAMDAARSGGGGRFAGYTSAKGESAWWDVTVSPMRDASGTPTHLLAVAHDITTARHHAEAGDLLNRELGHRIKNLFAVVNGLITLAARGDAAVQPFAATLRERISALSEALSYVLPSPEVTTPRQIAPTLHGLLGVLLDPYGGSAEERRAVILGDNPPVGPKATTGLALIVHELATNAVKYGALANPDGRVSITCRCTAESECELAWVERGGPVVAAQPQRTGFGSKLLLRSITGALGGRVTKRWDREGLMLWLVLPLTPLSQ